MALKLKKHVTNETRMGPTAKKSSEVLQDFASTGSHTAVRGNCCYDKKRYRVTSAVGTLHNQEEAERQNTTMPSIPAALVFFLSFFFEGGRRDWQGETDLDTLREIQARNKSERMMEEQQQWGRRK